MTMLDWSVLIKGSFMKTIHQLSKEQIAKIAAGEVIEKPVYAVKELIENSLDAKSTHIQILLEEGGLKKIQIIDDGVGMSEEDLKECFKLHTTSKLSSTDDLTAVHSMGFRGEALASLSSISRMSIKSRQSNALHGNEVVIESSKLITTSPVGIPTGTQIEISDLFYSVPARKKFMDNAQKEYRAILDWVIKITLANPATRFSLIHNKKVVFDVPKNQTTLQRLQFFLKENISFLPIEFEDIYIKINGFTSSSNFATSSSAKQFIFINNRPVIDKLISTAIKEAYGSTLDQHKNPIYLLNINIPYEQVDVNVHPRKEQVNFLNRQLVFDQVQKAIYQTLQINQSFFDKTVEKSITKSFAGQLLKHDVELFGVEKKFDSNETILQIFNLYLVFQAQNGLILVDQHAAHERILYEQLKKEFSNKKIQQIILEKPLQCDFSFSDEELLKENQDFFQKIGFTFNKKKQLAEIPNIFRDRNLKEIIAELLEQIRQDKKTTLDKTSDQMLKYLACRSAVKRGDKLTERQSKELITKLFNTPNFTHCPHGRPTFIEQSLHELNKQFMRF